MGDAFGTEVDVRSSDAAYGGERWGDYAGVAFDPVTPGAAWIVGETSAADGSWRTTVVRALVDGDAPSAPGVPFAVIVAPSTLSNFLPVRVAWGASTDATSSIAKYRILTNEQGLGFVSPGFSTTTSIGRPFLPFDTYAFRVSAIDEAGNEGPPSTSPTFSPTVDTTPAVSVTGLWHPSSSASFLGGSSRYSTAKGASATYHFTGRAFAFETYTATNRGSVNMYVDGVFRGTVSTYSTVAKRLQLVFSRAWTTSGAHTVKLVVVGTVGHPRVDVDGFVIVN
jgi:hypothetical protein